MGWAWQKDSLSFISACDRRKPVSECGIDQEELAHILRLPSWTAEQAAQVLEAQRKSGLSQAQYAAQRGFSVGRLYNWKSKLRAKLRTAPRPHY